MQYWMKNHPIPVHNSRWPTFFLSWFMNMWIELIECCCLMHIHFGMCVCVHVRARVRPTAIRILCRWQQFKSNKFIGKIAFVIWPSFVEKMFYSLNQRATFQVFNAYSCPFVLFDFSSAPLRSLSLYIYLSLLRSLHLFPLAILLWAIHIWIGDINQV